MGYFDAFLSTLRSADLKTHAPANSANFGSGSSSATPANAAKFANLANIDPKVSRISRLAGCARSEIGGGSALALRVDGDHPYRHSGVAWPPAETVALADYSELVGRMHAFGVRLSIERGYLTWWADKSLPDDLRERIGCHRERLADEIGNWKAQGDPWRPQGDPWSIVGDVEEPAFGDTSRWCVLCGCVATLADYDPFLRDEGRWLCEPCFEGEDHRQPPERQRRAAKPTETVALRLTRVPRHDEEARLDWWNQPVTGWAEGVLTISNVADSEAIEINLNK